MSKPFNVEFTSLAGGSKWVREIVSHTDEEIRELWKDEATATLKSKDGAVADIDFSKVWFMRFQDGETFERRSRKVQGGHS